MQNGRCWYWEVLKHGRDVMARGIADTHAQAQVDAERASRDETLIGDIEFADNGNSSNQATGGRYIRFVEARNLRLASRPLE
jgi:hypothetical protein